jgi:hypothetical protein
MAKSAAKGSKNSNARSIRVSFYERSTSSIGGVEEGIADDLLVVHNMAHTIIDDAPLSGAAGRISWTEAAYLLSDEFREWRDRLQTAVALLDKLLRSLPTS